VLRTVHLCLVSTSVWSSLSLPVSVNFISRLTFSLVRTVASSVCRERSSSSPTSQLLDMPQSRMVLHFIFRAVKNVVDVNFSLFRFPERLDNRFPLRQTLNWSKKKNRIRAKMRKKRNASRNYLQLQHEFTTFLRVNEHTCQIKREN